MVSCAQNEVECAGELATARAVSSAGTIMVCICECSSTGFEPLFPLPISTFLRKQPCYFTDHFVN